MHDVKRESDIKKWMASWKLGEQIYSRRLIFRNFVEFLVNYAYFWPSYSAATSPNELEILPELHSIRIYMILKKNHSVILGALLYLQRAILIAEPQKTSSSGVVFEKFLKDLLAPKRQWSGIALIVYYVTHLIKLFQIRMFLVSNLQELCSLP